ncbi:hypothetical protein H6G00_01860 [Leptolyngbya sp. FACHB-541]|uniref:hypothetical protein n=1 Tax=Leptolyngbya sp. FACHB-541 TaxID=2692810 RepID=UPI001685A412|nr:hypothetical protein [Leptolyngbya sp. FACHB-541]MBD1995377.1 hypothetical protein [Leptolyngbya sp. FACHB-541]
MTDYPTMEQLQEGGKVIKTAYSQIASLDLAKESLAYVQSAPTYQGKPKFPNACIVREGDCYNIAYEDIEYEPWNPTGKPKLDRTINIHCAAIGSRYDGITRFDGHTLRSADALHKNLDSSFKYIEGWGDGAYRVIWLSDELMAEASFCEGDISVYVADNLDAYAQIIRESMQCYTLNKEGGWVSIPESLKIAQSVIDQMPQDWRQRRLQNLDTDEVIARSFSADELWLAAEKFFEEKPGDYLRLDAGGSSTTFSKQTLERPGYRDTFNSFFS